MQDQAPRRNSVNSGRELQLARPPVAGRLALPVARAQQIESRADGAGDIAGHGAGEPRQILNLRRVGRHENRTFADDAGVESGSTGTFKSIYAMLVALAFGRNVSHL